MKEAIAAFASGGGKVIAECGGMMYLGKSIIDEQGNIFPMAGIFDFSTSMENKKLSLGYRSVTFDGLYLTGHEFRYSSLVHHQYLPSVAKIFSARGLAVETRMYRYKNVLASYIHFYWAEDNRLEQILKTLK
jgi:cobyrinic acid a,c-diamide synthase